MTLHNEPYTIHDLWWIMYKAFYNIKPKGTYKKEWFYNVSCAFDIETTSIIVNDEKQAYMYIWMLGIDGYCIVGRKWSEFIYCLDKISEYCGLGENVYLPIYVHNLSYEFQFIKDLFTWQKIFALDTRKPNYCRTIKGIEFRCSYQLSGYSLESVGKHLHKYKIEKLVGNLDYKKIRTYETQLTDEELAYCINDVLVVMAYIQECIEEEKYISNIPLTKTGYVRRYVKRKCLGTSKNRNDKYRKFIKRLTLEPSEYQQLKRAFQGGFTHASALHSTITLHDIDSYDFTSSYPAVMLSEKFPMSKSELIDIKSNDELETNLKLYCCLFDVRFTNIRSKEMFEHYISMSKCRAVVNVVLDNGRIVSADRLSTTITEQDFMIIKRMYEWDDMEIANFRRYQKDYLPKEFMDAILTLYENKTKLKDVKGSESEYMRSKESLNSLYGMTVTDIVRNEIYYENGEWLSESQELEQAINKYNKSRARFMFYPWGVWITAYARANLWTGIITMKEDYVYSDTDSLKILNGDKHKNYIENYNRMVTNKIKRALEIRDIPINRTRPKTIRGIEKPIGVWDYEGHYITFKTLGAKRYLWKNIKGNYQITVAGLNKKTSLRYLLFAHKDNKNVFDIFNDELYIPKGWAGKMIHTYIDDSYSAIIEDYQGHITKCYEKSGLYMEESDYSLSIGEQYARFLLGINEIKD